MASNHFRVGDRVELVSTTDQYTDLRVGTRGTVTGVHALTVDVNWDDGSTLSMLLDEGDEIKLWFESLRCPGRRSVVDCECADADGHVDECRFDYEEV